MSFVLMNFTMDSSIAKVVKIPEYIQMYIDSKQVLNILLKIVFIVVFLANISLVYLYITISFTKTEGL